MSVALPLPDAGIAARTRSAIGPGLMLVACALGALALQALLIPIDGDVSWLITVSERVLAGQQLYVDVMEVNPPASVWLYLPQVWLAQLTGARPEALVALIAAASAIASSLATLRLACRLRRPPDPIVLAAALGFATLLLPGGLFAQREHYALLLALPALTAIALVAEGRWLPLRQSLATGAAAGLVCTIKPHFALAILLPAAFAAARTRALRPLLQATLAATAIVIIYAIALLSFAPAYLDYLPVLASTYMPMHENLRLLLAGACVTMPIAFAMLAYLARPRFFPMFPAAMLLGMAGFAIAALLQGKGYANHALPGTALGAIAIAALLGDRSRGRQHLAWLALFLLAGSQFQQAVRIAPPKGLVETLRGVAPPRPSMITLGTELVTGHPAVRLVDGQWAGSRAAMFTAAGVRFSRSRSLPAEERAALERHYRDDLRTFADDVGRNRPDVVLVEARQKHWMLDDPILSAAMRDYRAAARAGDIEIWLRRGPLR